MSFFTIKNIKENQKAVLQKNTLKITLESQVAMSAYQHMLF
jgi:hypothetical protein